MDVPTINLSFFRIAFLVCLFAAGCNKGGTHTDENGPDNVTQVVGVKAERARVAETLSLAGTMQPNESVDIKSQVAGLVVKIGFEEGQRVERNALLIELDTDKLDASLLQARANQRLAESKFARARDLAQTRAVSQQELEEARAIFDASQATVDLCQQQIKEMRIIAPFGGIMGARMISPGQVIAPQHTLTTIADFDPVKVELSVPERFTTRVRVGQKIEFGVVAFPGEKFAGEVYFVASQLDPITRTGLVKARVPNPDLRLKPGMFANLDLKLKIEEEAVVVPEAALMPHGAETLIYIVDEQMRAQIRPVTAGMREAGRVEILHGLVPGETVVVEGWQNMRPGGKVKLAPAMAVTPYLAAKETQPTKTE